MRTAYKAGNIRCGDGCLGSSEFTCYIFTVKDHVLNAVNEIHFDLNVIHHLLYSISSARHKIWGNLYKITVSAENPAILYITDNKSG